MAIFVMIALVAGCGQFYRYEYMSFEGTHGAVVQSTARVEFEGLFFGPTIPVEYSIEREGYALRILIDETTSATNATVELAETSGHEIVLRHWERGVRPGRPVPCGSIDGPDHPRTRYSPRYSRIKTSPRFTFLWITCNTPDPGELVIAFDVVDESGAATKENLRFELKYQGSYFIRHSL